MRSGWTLDTVLQYLLDLRAADMRLSDQRFESQIRAVEAALSSARSATEKADSANEKRFESQNEFRGQIKDTQALYITRTEVMSLVGDQSAFVTRTEMFSWAGVGQAVGGVMGYFLK